MAQPAMGKNANANARTFAALMNNNKGAEGSVIRITTRGMRDSHRYLPVKLK